MDRIDIHVHVPRVDYQKLSNVRMGESSETIQARVEIARQRQLKRFLGTGIMNNADMTVAQIRQFCLLDEPSQALLKTAMRQLQLSARAYHRVLKLALSIADLAQSDAITQVHLAEAIQYRPKEFDA